MRKALAVLLAFVVGALLSGGAMRHILLSDADIVMTHLELVTDSGYLMLDTQLFDETDVRCALAQRIVARANTLKASRTIEHPSALFGFSGFPEAANQQFQWALGAMESSNVRGYAEACRQEPEPR